MTDEQIQAMRVRSPSRQEVERVLDEREELLKALRRMSDQWDRRMHQLDSDALSAIAFAEKP